MSSKSVWYEEVDRGFIALIKKVLGDNIPIHFTPNVNTGTKVAYPLVKIHHLGEKFDQYRYDPTPVTTRIDYETKRVVRESSAKPYTLSYQIDIVSTSKGKLNDLSLKWRAFLEPHFNLEVKDKSGEPRSCYVITTNSVQVTEQEQNDLILYRSIYRFDIKVELDEVIESTTPVVTKVDINFK